MPIVANVDGEFYPTGPDVAPADDRSAREDRWPRRCNSSKACTRCTTRARGSSSRSDRRKPCRDSPRTCSARQPRSCLAVHQSSQIRRRDRLQPGAVRALCRGVGPRDCGTGNCPSTLRGNGLRHPPVALHSVRGVPHITAVDAAAWLSNGPLTRPHRPVAITGAALGLPGTEHIFDDGNVARILRGDQFIDADPCAIPPRHARQTHHAAGQERKRRAASSSPSPMWRM